MYSRLTIKTPGRRHWRVSRLCSIVPLFHLVCLVWPMPDKEGGFRNVMGIGIKSALDQRILYFFSQYYKWNFQINEETTKLQFQAWCIFDRMQSLCFTLSIYWSVKTVFTERHNNYKSACFCLKCVF